MDARSAHTIYPYSGADTYRPTCKGMVYKGVEGIIDGRQPNARLATARIPLPAHL